MSEMICGRPQCDRKENRIDGYCSVYCRDIHELELLCEGAKITLQKRQEIMDSQAELIEKLGDVLKIAVDEIDPYAICEKGTCPECDILHRYVEDAQTALEATKEE